LRENLSSGKPVLESDRLVLESWLQETIITYCTRVIEQSALPPAKDSDSISSTRGAIANPELADAALYEVIRILDLICLLDPNPVPQMFEIVKKIHSRMASKPNGFIYLACLQFFLHHSEIVVYDADQAFRNFFDQFLSKQCMSITTTHTPLDSFITH